MSAYKDFLSLIRKTEIMQEVLQSLEKEPARLLSSICREYGRTGQPVPDHHLPLYGYISEIGLKALLGAGLVKLQSGSRFTLYCYEPTPQGIEQYQSLTTSGLLPSK